MYKLEYLPQTMQDMAELARYISQELSNPTAADKLANELVEAAERLRDFPYKNRVYQLIRPLKREYRGQIVQNHILFYYVDEEEKIVTIARVIYARRDYGKLLG
ncbi:MAG: type II toxin-antitoxin system RelE/ParE family toxin [Oscillospiraceae bacterium]|nr:type II toxin-antitoxin system RelE/ParE family toxin [Oscillospiraceae bacterium]